jgi:hypothetical protein
MARVSRSAPWFSNALSAGFDHWIPRQAEVRQMKLLKWFFEPSCAHRFTWPRMENNGRHYQICLVCGTAYEYDWERMRRTNRLVAEGVEHGYPEPVPLPGVWQRAFHLGH